MAHICHLLIIMSLFLYNLGSIYQYCPLKNNHSRQKWWWVNLERGGNLICELAWHCPDACVGIVAYLNQWKGALSEWHIYSDWYSTSVNVLTIKLIELLMC